MGRLVLRSERGATMLLVAAGLLLLIGIAAMVVDLGGLRFDRRADRLATDAAATAGAAAIDPFAGSQADTACQDAWDYLLLNLEDEGTAPASPNCATFAGSCVPTTARQETGSAGPYTVTFTHPVPDGHPLMGGQAPNADFDGAPCQRFGVELNRVRDFAFAGALGSDSGSTTVRSVARIGAGRGKGEVVPLLLLEPIGCDALFTSGQGGITVTYFEDSPGFIVVDSNGSKVNNPNRCANANEFTIDAKGNENGWIRAIPTPDGVPSAILSFALSGRPGAQAARSHDPGDLIDPVSDYDVSDPPESRFRLYPRPQGVSRRITRAPIDWRYNCKPSYPGYPVDPTDPGLGSIPIEGCSGSSGAHIDALVSTYGTGNPSLGITNRIEGAECVPTTDRTYVGDWHVDCPGGFIIGNDPITGTGLTVSFSGGNVVFEGSIDLRSFGNLNVNADLGGDRVVYVRNGDIIKRAQASIAMHQTFVYLENGVIDLVGGVGGLTWTAPLDGDFEDLALWSESFEVHQIGGQAGNTLTGTFFTPMANPFTLTGQGGQFQTDAQFLTRRLEVKGQGEVRMRPDPDRQTLIPIREVFLIR